MFKPLRTINKNELRQKFYDESLDDLNSKLDDYKETMQRACYSVTAWCSLESSWGPNKEYKSGLIIITGDGIALAAKMTIKGD